MRKSVEKELIKTFQIKTSPLWYYLSLFFNIVGGTISYTVLRKTDLQKAKKCFIFGLVLFLIPITIFVVINFILGMQYSVYMVKNAADEQNLRIYDVVIIDSNIPIENIKVGDLIIFYNLGTHQEVLIHRVVQILSKDPLPLKQKATKPRVHSRNRLSNYKTRVHWQTCIHNTTNRIRHKTCLCKINSDNHCQHCRNRCCSTHVIS